ncbi:CDP-glycerol glycerophosphotransferase family protein [Endozoicomonas lisbonensis]|uniref:CDP-glycerol--glycerophosphate glycerophosphotransferase n=1 Tax=Endozoicomonas lisbonensis TaxID=3120522 RepID=A0ABV2SP01_9GAMM
MGNVKRVLRAIIDLIQITNVPKAQKNICFYSEGESYWPHLKGLVSAVLEYCPFDICYISSSVSDPGLKLKHKKFKSFYIGDHFIRDYFFQNIECEVMIMTMPDLHKYQVKRSRYSVHYVYVQHSLVSLHMVYRNGAFDHYDTICCAGEHHVKEIRSLEKTYNLTEKRILKHGYSRFDELRSRFKLNSHEGLSQSSQKSILVAPSWGAEAIVESGIGYEIISNLIGSGYRTIFRPHPQTIKLSHESIKVILDEFSNHPYFTFDSGVGDDSLYYSDIMISDWSGVALEYALALNKPVLFCDIKRKINNENYIDIDIEPLEVKIREKIGIIWDPSDCFFSALKNCEEFSIQNREGLISNILFNPSSSNCIFAKHLTKMVTNESI